MSLQGRTTLSILSLLALLLPQLASAQSLPELDIERFAPATSPDGFLAVQATRTPGPGRYTLLIAADYEAKPFALGAVSYTAYGPSKIDRRVAAWLGGELGIGGRFAVGALLPMYPYQRAHAELPRAGGVLSRDEPLDFALGDARLHARYRVIGESNTSADAPKDGPGLAFEARAMLPTHAGAILTGDDNVSAELHALADFQLLGAGIGGDIGWKHRFGGVRLGDDSIHDEFLFGAAIKLPLPPVPAVVPILEFRGATDFRSARATALEIDLGAHVLLGAFKLMLGGGFGLSDGYGTPDGRVLLGLSFTPQSSDKDADGVDDGSDQCPFLAEDKDGFQDQDGCPDPDNDNDLIPDLDDLCPNDQAEEDKDQDEDGCTDGTTPTTKR